MLDPMILKAREVKFEGCWSIGQLKFKVFNLRKTCNLLQGKVLFRQIKQPKRIKMIITKTPSHPAEWLTAAQVAQACSVSLRTIYNYLPLLPTYKIGGGRLFKTTDLQKIKTVICKN